MFEIATTCLLVTLSASIIRAWLGPTIFDRAQAVNSAGTIAVLLIASYGFLSNRPDFLDLAIIYGLLNVVGTISILKFFRFGDLGGVGKVERKHGNDD
tara:strand:+ start:45 stop:338 length:294 start_codon:yes stop_codon:yes gene_type:complete